MENQGVQEEESLITIEDRKASEKKASKHKPSVLVNMSLLIVDITDNYEGNKEKRLIIADIL